MDRWHILNKPTDETSNHRKKAGEMNEGLSRLQASWELSPVLERPGTNDTTTRAKEA